MSIVLIKSFFGHKRGIGYWEGADRIAMNLENGRFAIADGVSQSHLSNLWADILCQAYVNSIAPANNDWIMHYVAENIVYDCQLWEKQSEDVVANATPDKAFLLQMTQEEYQYAGSTLAGITIEQQLLYYHVLGDSCIYIIDSQTGKPIRFSTVKEEEGFTASPDYLSSDGRMIGSPIYGQMPIESCFVILMTDAFSDWFETQYAKDARLMQLLWNLNNHSEFIQFVENARDCDDLKMKDDDVALLMLKIEDNQPTQFEVIHSDYIENLLISTQITDDSVAMERNKEEKDEAEIVKREEVKPYVPELECSEINNNSSIEPPQQEMTFSDVQNASEQTVFDMDNSDIVNNTSENINPNDVKRSPTKYRCKVWLHLLWQLRKIVK
jgi:serine/threonine protein phosphatase PrpC